MISSQRDPFCGIASAARALLASALCIGSFECPADAATSAPSFGKAEVAGIVLDGELAEISGIAASRRHRNVLWAINDSGNGAQVFAISTRGTRLAEFTIEGVDNVDWEDLSAFDRDGRRYLLIADTGDNGGQRDTVELVLVEEPGVLEAARLTPAARLVVRWPDGPRDCEALAVDAARGEILLLSKKRVPAQLFSLPLAALFSPAPRAPAVAQEIAQIRALPQPTEQELALPSRMGRYRAQISGMALRADGLLAVQTYRDTYVFRRKRDQDWRQALRATPEPLHISVLPQPESVAFDPVNGDLYIASERIPSPILRLRSTR